MGTKQLSVGDTAIVVFAGDAVLGLCVGSTRGVGLLIGFLVGLGNKLELWFFGEDFVGLAVGDHVIFGLIVSCCLVGRTVGLDVGLVVGT